MPCMHPMEMSRNRHTNRTSRIVLELVQPLRQSRSAKTIDTSPVKSMAAEKNRNGRTPRRAGRWG